MTYSNVARGVVGLLTANIVGAVLYRLTGCPPVLAYIGGGIIGAFAMAADILWAAFCVWFWPSRLTRTDSDFKP